METLRHLTLCLGLVVAAALVGCAPGNPAAPASNVIAQPSPRTGTILSMRSVTVLAGEGALHRLLVDSGATQPAGNGNAAPLTEFIVRTDEGTTPSIVQASAIDLHPGDRVVILRDTSVHLVRPGPAEQRKDNRA